MKHDGAGHPVTSVLYRSHTQTHMQGNEPIIRHKSLTFFTLLGSDSWCCLWTLGFKSPPTLVSRVSGTKAYYHPCLTIFLGFCFSLKMHLFIVLCMCSCSGYVGGGLCDTHLEMRAQFLGIGLIDFYVGYRVNSNCQACTAGTFS